MDINDVDLDPEFEDEGSQSYEQQDDSGGSQEYPEYIEQGNTAVTPSPSDDNKTSEDVMMDFLKFNGISDPEKIKFEDVDGIVKERSWNDLSYQEKMNVLTTSHDEPERDLSEDEIIFLNTLRSNNITPSQYINTIRQQAAIDSADNAKANDPQFKVSELTDDQIFLLDLQDKLDDQDVSDEEMLAALEKAKEDPLYSKRVAGMRKELETLQQNQLAQMEAEKQQFQQEQFQQFSNSVVNNILSLNKIGDLDINLDRNDQEDIASFILDKDDTGQSYMGKALNDPKTLVEMAFWTLKGRDTINSISNYFDQQIKNIRQSSYQKGLEDGRKGTSRVVYKPQSPQTKGREATIDDIWG